MTKTIFTNGSVMIEILNRIKRYVVLPPNTRWDKRIYIPLTERNYGVSWKRMFLIRSDYS